MKYFCFSSSFLSLSYSSYTHSVSFWLFHNWWIACSMFLNRLLFKVTLEFKQKFKGRYIHFLDFPMPSYMNSLFHFQHIPFEWCIYYGWESTLTHHHHHTLSIVYTRIHLFSVLWFLWVWTNYSNTHYSSLSSSLSNYWPFYCLHIFAFSQICHIICQIGFSHLALYILLLSMSFYGLVAHVFLVTNNFYWPGGPQFMKAATEGHHHFQVV